MWLRTDPTSKLPYIVLIFCMVLLAISKFLDTFPISSHLMEAVVSDALIPSKWGFWSVFYGTRRVVVTPPPYRNASQDKSRVCSTSLKMGSDSFSDAG